MRAKKRETIAPDLTPLIDVLFILLIFFLVTSVFKKEELALILDLPSSNAKELMIEKKEVSIEIGIEQMAIFGKKVTINQLNFELHKIKDKKSDIIIRIDKNVKYEKIVKVFNLLQKYELNNLFLVTKR